MSQVTQERMKELIALSAAVREHGGKAEERLRAKCQWEHMTRTAVINTWGDPRNWK